MWMKSRAALLLLLLVGRQPLFGAAPYHLNQLFHRVWTTADGAPGLAYDELQDADGYLWMSTSSGLYRFDGSHFLPFQSPPGQPYVRPQFYALSKTRSGMICGTSLLSGVICIDHGNVVTYGTEQGLPPTPARSLSSGPDGSLWLVADKHLYHLQGGRWTREGFNSPAAVDGTFFGRDGAQWLIADSASFVRDGETFRPSGVSWPNGSELEAVAEGPHGELWGAIVYSSKLSRLQRLDKADSGNGTATTLTFPYEVRDSKFDADGNLWVVGSGVDRITFPDTGGAGGRQKIRIEHLGKDAGLSSLETHGVLKDNQGNIWIITQNGLDLFRSPNLVRANPGSSANTTRPVVAAGQAGQVWVGVGGKPLQERSGDQTREHGKAFEFHYGLAEGSDGTLWFDDGASLFHMQRDVAIPVRVPRGEMVLLIRQIVPLPDRSVLIRFKDTLWRLRGSSWTKYQPDSMLHEVPSYLLLDKKQQLWRGYASGFVSNGREVFRPDPATHVEAIHFLAETSLGLLAADDLRVYALRDRHFVPLLFAGALPSTGISGICEGRNGDLWMNGGRGILHFSRAAFASAMLSPGNNRLQGSIITEPDLHGPAPALYNTPTLLSDATGRLWANTADAIVFLDPDRFVPDASAPILSLGSLSADGVPQRSSSLRLPAGVNTIRIPYFGASLGAQDRVQYRYRLGSKEGWQDVGARTEAVYTDLPPGAYSFAVSASNSEGRWTEPAHLSFSVSPRFYQRLWFQALATCAVLLLLWTVFQAQLRSAAYRAREKAEEREKERVRIAQDLHDTLLQGFQGLMLAFHVAAQQIPPESRVQEHVAGALTRADHVMTEARERIGQLRSHEGGTSLREALRNLEGEQQNVDDAAYRVQVRGYEYQLEESIEAELLLIAREAVTNAFRHASAMEISVELFYGPRQFRMRCKDDGRGTASDRRRDGHYGLLGMEERARGIGATFTRQSSPNTGTVIEVRLRKAQAQLDPSWWSRLKATLAKG